MIGNDWDEKLQILNKSESFKEFIKLIKKEYEEKIIFPNKALIFKALKMTPFANVKVVILGQDPYHGEGEANGLAFSVPKGIKLPPSLLNIYKELKTDLNIQNYSGDLTSWAKEGVLLLNSILTVEKDKPASHQELGWEKLTNYIIKLLNAKDTPIVFILWGKAAYQKKEYITNKKHLVLTSTHPSPFSANKGFFGSRPFSKTNAFLVKTMQKEINWQID